MNLDAVVDLEQRQEELTASARDAIAECERLAPRAPDAVAAVLAVKVPDIPIVELAAEVRDRLAAALRASVTYRRRISRNQPLHTALLVRRRIKNFLRLQ